MNIEKELLELADFSLAEDSELGEAAWSLYNLDNYIDHFSDEFIVLLKKEILSHLNFFKENATIITTPKTTTVDIKSLKWGKGLGDNEE